MTDASDGGPDFHGRRVIVFDTELTDKPDPGKESPEIVQHGWIELEPAAHVGAFFLLEKPQLEDYTAHLAGHQTHKVSSPGALAVHGLLPEDVEGLPEFSVEDDLFGPNLVMIGHSIDADWEAARRYAAKAPPVAGDDLFGDDSPRTVLDDVPRICTLAMSRRIFGPQVQCSLGALMFHIRGANAETRDMVKGAHDAMADCFMTMELLFHILKRRPEIKSWKALWEFSEDSRMPRHWPLGKYGPKDNGGVGQPLEAARHDTGYLNWVRDTFWKKDPYLVRAVNKMVRGELAP